MLVMKLMAHHVFDVNSVTPVEVLIRLKSRNGMQWRAVTSKPPSKSQPVAFQWHSSVHLTSQCTLAQGKGLHTLPHALSNSKNLTAGKRYKGIF